MRIFISMQKVTNTSVTDRMTDASKYTGKRCNVNKQPKCSIKWSAVPLPCSTFSLVFMEGVRAAASIRDEDLQNGEIFRPFVRPFVRPSPSPSGPWSQAGWASGLAGWLLLNPFEKKKRKRATDRKTDRDRQTDRQQVKMRHKKKSEIVRESLISKVR